MKERKGEIISNERLLELTETIKGAFAEGIDLGCRETQIRSIGESLHASIQYLRTALANINIDPDGEHMSRYLNTISCLAELATSYGAIECVAGNKVKPKPS